MIGQEAHIIAAAENGPRHEYLPAYDMYDNLILLCSNHHKPADDQVKFYTKEQLQKYKHAHEAWIASQDGDGQAIRLVPDPVCPIPRTLTVVMTGNALWDIASGATARYPSWESSATDEQRDLIVTFLDDLGDWLDAEALNGGCQVGRDAAKHLNEHVKALTETGLLIGVRKRHCLLTGGVGDPSPWTILDIEIQPLSIAHVADMDDTAIWPPSDAAAS